MWTTCIEIGATILLAVISGLPECSMGKIVRFCGIVALSITIVSAQHVAQFLKHRRATSDAGISQQQQQEASARQEQINSDQRNDWNTLLQAQTEMRRIVAEPSPLIRATMAKKLHYDYRRDLTEKHTMQDGVNAPVIRNFSANEAATE